MVKPSRDDIKKEIEEEEKLVSGEGTLGSGAPDPEADDDTGEALKEVIGHEPEPGGTIAHEVEEAEKARRGREPHEGEEKESPKLQ